MTFVTNLDSNFVSKMVSAIVSAVTNDITEDIRRSGLTKDTMNSYPTRVWDLINRNIFNKLSKNEDCVIGICNRGPWYFTAVFHKPSGILFTVMREERLTTIRKEQSNSHYVKLLADVFNADLEINQQSFFTDNNKDDAFSEVAKICNALSLSTDIVERHALVLFSAKDELVRSIRCCNVNSAFEEFNSVSWNEYISVEESPIVDQVSNDDFISSTPALSLALTNKALDRKKIKHTLSGKTDREQTDKAN